MRILDTILRLLPYQRTMLETGYTCRRDTGVVPETSPRH